MNIKQEPKYAVNEHGNLYNRETGNVIPDDEPVFILRARDIHAVQTLLFYLRQCEIDGHAKTVEGRVNDFLSFEAKHPERMREPGALREANNESKSNAQ